MEKVAEGREEEEREGRGTGERATVDLGREAPARAEGSAGGWVRGEVGREVAKEVESRARHVYRLLSPCRGPPGCNPRRADQTW